MMYQWNRSTGWYDDAGTPTGALKGGGTTTAWEDITSGLEWASANDPSPAGWRIPTMAELQSLFITDKVSNEWTSLNGVYGRLFTDKTTGKSLFLPAAGQRDYHDGTFYEADTRGFYWGSAQGISEDAFILYFSSSYTKWNYISRGYGYSVRCVADSGTVTDSNEFTVMGKVTDCNDAPIPSVTVTGYLTGDEASTSITASTDSNGDYSLQFPANSDVTITVKSSDYANYSSEVSYAINGVSGGSVVQQPVKLPCVAVANACGTYDEYVWNGDTSVVINDVTWATRNVDAPGTFAASPESYGMHYQWNRSTGWYDNAGTPTGALTGGGTTTSWDDSTPSGTTWESANDPSPAGWRVPALAEIQTLFDTAMVSNKWTACNGVCGRLFTDKTTGKSLFLPAAGYRDYYDGTHIDAGTYGNCWSSTPSGSYNAYSLDFYSGGAGWYYYGSRIYGFSVRCVQ
jgi:uncharacterized protein (TIGR02145 family)